MYHPDGSMLDSIIQEILQQISQLQTKEQKQTCKVVDDDNKYKNLTAVFAAFITPAFEALRAAEQLGNLQDSMITKTSLTQ